MPREGLHYTIDANLVDRCRDLLKKFRLAIRNSYAADAAANALGLNNPDLNNALKGVFEKKNGRRSIYTSTIVDLLIAGLRQDAPLARNHFEPCSRTSSFWDATRAVRLALAADLEAELNAKLGHQGSAGTSPGGFLGTSTASTQAPSSLWELVGPGHFARPSCHIDDEVRAFLRGRQRTALWLAKHGSIWRGDIVDRIVARLDDVSFLSLTGPAGHGKSMLALQTLAAWVERGWGAIVAHDEAALHDPALETACRSGVRTIVLLDDIPITTPLPVWLRQGGEPAARLLQVVQTRRMAAQRLFLPTRAAWMRAPVPKDIQPYVVNLMAFKAGFSSDYSEVAERFSQALSQGNFRGGLWEATWEATRGHRIDERIGAIVGEVFDDPARIGEQVSLAAVTFLNGAVEFSQDMALHSRLTLDSRRSTLRLLIESHPDLSLRARQAGLDHLDRTGELLADELFTGGQDGHLLDHFEDPLIEFRSASVTHSFYRWQFGALRGTGRYRISRWPFYSALTAVLTQRRAGATEFVGALHSLISAWKTRPHLRQRFDHGRSEADVSSLAREIAEASPADSLSASCRTNLYLASAALLATREPNVTESRVAALRQDAEIRLLAATVDNAPADVLVRAADLLLSYDLTLATNAGPTTFDQLIDRILRSRTDHNTKQQARYLRFKWTCQRRQGVDLDPCWATLSRENLLRLQRDRHFLSILHGYLDIVSNPASSSRGVTEAFFSSDKRTFGLESMVSLYAFAMPVLAADAALTKALATAVTEDGRFAHAADHHVVAGLRRIVRAAASALPFYDAFGPELTALRDTAVAQVNANDFTGLPLWLSATAALLEPQDVPLSPTLASARD